MPLGEDPTSRRSHRSRMSEPEGRLAEDCEPYPPGAAVISLWVSVLSRLKDRGAGAASHGLLFSDNPGGAVTRGEHAVNLLSRRGGGLGTQASDGDGSGGVGEAGGVGQ